ncbi:hypothetical protein PQX77_002038 [Marasmius sp. AFHP31]|nr:hypothetical protein PQX77_002038 [Marasmius sp. AFHP31]
MSTSSPAFYFDLLALVPASAAFLPRVVTVIMVRQRGAISGFPAATVVASSGPVLRLVFGHAMEHTERSSGGVHAT